MKTLTFLDMVSGLACSEPYCGCKRVVNHEVKTHCPLWHNHENGDATPSLSLRLRDRIAWVTCHRGCDRSEVQEALFQRGLWCYEPYSGYVPDIGVADSSPRRPAGDENDKHHTSAMRCWDWSQTEMRGTPVERYLTNRGIERYVTSKALRYHPELWHRETDTTYPGMVALVFDTHSYEPIAVHRTYLTEDGHKAPISANKKTLGRYRGRGIVPLDDPKEFPSRICIGEGIETTCSGGVIFGVPAWCGISSANLRGGLALTESVKEVVILEDNDLAGHSCANDAAWYWQQRGLIVTRYMPNVEGHDFNDVLLQQGTR
ncbi:DUF7146 domain-containing protein [Rhodopila sp.]|uniref:DUF7146 domain-containing protein n=1 Tax=Rhodopila sp. TaxID=2480087 RepID=UPI003D15276B